MGGDGAKKRRAERRAKEQAEQLQLGKPLPFKAAPPTPSPPSPEAAEAAPAKAQGCQPARAAAIPPKAIEAAQAKPPGPQPASAAAVSPKAAAAVEAAKAVPTAVKTMAVPQRPRTAPEEAPASKARLAYSTPPPSQTAPSWRVKTWFSASSFGRQGEELPAVLSTACVVDLQNLSPQVRDRFCTVRDQINSDDIGVSATTTKALVSRASFIVVAGPRDLVQWACTEIAKALQRNLENCRLPHYLTPELFLCQAAQHYTDNGIIDLVAAASDIQRKGKGKSKGGAVPKLA